MPEAERDTEAEAVLDNDRESDIEELADSEQYVDAVAVGEAVAEFVPEAERDRVFEAVPENDRESDIEELANRLAEIVGVPETEGDVVPETDGVAVGRGARKRSRVPETGVEGSKEGVKLP